MLFVRGVIAFTFMLVGYYLKDYYKSDVNKRWDVIILSGTLTYVIAMLNEQIDFWCSRVGNPILCLIGGLIGAYWVIGLSKNIKSKLLVFIGQNTMTMMGTHMIMFRNSVEFVFNKIFQYHTVVDSKCIWGNFNIYFDNCR